MVSVVSLLLAFTRQKDGREIGTLNWTQEHKSVWYGPHRRLWATPPGQRAISPCRSRPACRCARELGSQATAHASAACDVTRADFLKIGHFAPFSQSLHIKWRNFPDVFYPFTSTYDPYKPWKVSCKSVHTFLRNLEDRHTHTHMWHLYIYIDECQFWI